MLRKLFAVAMTLVWLTGGAQAQSTPQTLQNQINSVPWTNGQQQITGAEVMGMFNTIVQVFENWAAPLNSPTFTGTVTIPNGTALGTPASINLTNATLGGSIIVAHVASVAALQAYPAIVPTTVIRDGYAQVGDAPSMAYALQATCPFPGAQPDNGACVAAIGGQYWVAVFPASGADVREWGVVPDGYTAADGVASAFSTIFTSPSRLCSSFDAGKVITISAAGASAAPLQTTVSSCVGTSFVLAASASTAQSNIYWGLGTDNAAKLAEAAAAMVNGTLCLPTGQFALSGATILLNHVNLCGQNNPQDRVAAYGINARQGSTILLMSQSTQPFTLAQSVRISGVSFFWPGQGGVTSQPANYPALFVDTGTSSLSDVTMDDIGVINAFQFFSQNSAALPMGAWRIRGSNIYAINNAFTMNNVGEVIPITDTIFNPSIFYSVANTGNQYLGIYSATAGNWLIVSGNGTSGTCASTAVGGLEIGSGVVINGYATVFNVTTGALDEFSVSSGADLNGVGDILYVAPAGIITRSNFTSRMYPNGSFGVVGANAAFTFAGTCSGGATGGLGDVRIDGNIVGANNGVIVVGGTNLQELDMPGTVVETYGCATQTNPIYLLIAENSNTRINMTGVKSFPCEADANHRGILALTVTSLNYVGSSSFQTYNMVDTTGLTSGKVNIVGNVATTSQGTYTLAGSLSVTGNKVQAFGNTFDKPNPGLDALLPGTPALTVAQLLATTCNTTASVGATAFVFDYTPTPTWGTTIAGGSGGGANRVQALCNGSSWTVMGF